MPKMRRVNNGMRQGRANRVARVQGEVRGNREYTSATRNPYDAPSEAYTGTETPTPPPPKWTKARQEWEKKIGELRARGLSYIDIAVELDTSETQVGEICRARGFIKGTKS